MNSLNLVAKVDADSDTQKYIGPPEPIWTTSPSWTSTLIAADWESTTNSLSNAAAGIFSIGISGNLLASIVPVSFSALIVLIVVFIVTFLDPSNDSVVEPVTSPFKNIFLPYINVSAADVLEAYGTVKLSEILFPTVTRI